MKHKTIAYFLIILSLLYLTISLPTFLPVQTTEQKQNNIQNNNVNIESTSIEKIFTNNFWIAAITFIPYFGWGFSIFVMWRTGLVVASYDNSLVLLALNPFAWIELSVLAFCILVSFRLAVMLRNKELTKTKRLKLLGIHAFETLLASAVILLFSATIEYLIVAWSMTQ